ncbi:hypothetical protein TNCV_1561211 [Trichonephila clavipes]|nr:hypothetical protein TNCV_1561211 [Trichonephila clavipes]
MSKLPDLDTINRGKIAGEQCMDYSISEIVRKLGFSRLTVSGIYHEYTDAGQKNSDRANYKEQLALAELWYSTSDAYCMLPDKSNISSNYHPVE